jgi:hypothetical protein
LLYYGLKYIFCFMHQILCSWDFLLKSPFALLSFCVFPNCIKLCALL